MSEIKIKVCGMKDPQNMESIQDLKIDFMGFIFYARSPRAIQDLDPSMIPTNKYGLERVGVFVDEDIEVIKEKIITYQLDLVQLHGRESYKDCLVLNEIVPVIKAFCIKDSSDLEKVNSFGKFWGYYLFDTKTPNYGGSGQKFDWSVLDAYKGEMPFFLSGGISPVDAEKIKLINHPLFCGIDLNSKFEIEPGFKNIETLKKFINEIRR